MSNMDNTLDFRRFFRAARKFWWLYLMAFLFIMGAAVTYSIVRMPSYDTTATMLIEDSSDPSSSSGGIAAMLGRSFSIGGFGNSSVNNEVYVLDSHDVVMATAKALGLNRTYILKDGLRKELLYPDSPILVEAPQEYFDTLSLGYNIYVKILSDGRTDIEFKQGRFFQKTIIDAENVTLPYVSQNPDYPVTIVRTDYFESDKDYKIQVAVSSYESAAALINEKVTTEEPDKLSDAIRLTYEGPNKVYNKALLNELLAQYNKKRIERRQETAQREIEFLNSRISQQIADLTMSEEKMEEYMKANNITSIEEEVRVLVEKSLSNEASLRGLLTSQEYYRQVLNTLRNPETQDDLIPIQSSTSSPMIADYNALVLERKSLRRSATPDNSAMKLLDSSIADLRSSIEKSTENILAERALQIKALKKEENATTGRLSKMPAYEREFFNLSRDKELQNQLYLFLIEKRENALLKYDSNSTLGFVVEQAYCSIKPSKKKSIIACGAGLFLSLLLPSFLVFLWTLWKQNIESPIDLNFSGLESRSVMVKKDSKEIRKLRQMIESIQECNTVYALNLSDDRGFLQQLSSSFDDLGLKTQVLISEKKDNDSILSAPFARILDDVRREGRLPIVSVPDIDNVYELSLPLNDSQSILLIIIDENEISRKYFRRIIKENIPAAKIITAILY